MDGVYAENAGAVFCLLTDHRGRFHQRRSMVEQLIATCFRGPRRLAPVGSIPVRRGTFSQQPALVYRQSSISRHVSQISPDKNMHFRSTKLPRPRQLLLRCPNTVHPWTYAHAPYLHPCRQSAACPTYKIGDRSNCFAVFLTGFTGFFRIDRILLRGR